MTLSVTCVFWQKVREVFNRRSGFTNHLKYTYKLSDTEVLNHDWRGDWGWTPCPVPLSRSFVCVPSLRLTYIRLPGHLPRVLSRSKEARPALHLIRRVVFTNQTVMKTNKQKVPLISLTQPLVIKCIIVLIWRYDKNLKRFKWVHDV